ncbi:MAG: hypothetical protein HRU11_07480 [Parvularculaceae bacterium]|nr:hypothetical protein [Parvularculaceae bacterium]
MTASDLLRYGAETTFWVSVLTILVLLLRAPVTKHVGSRAAMLLWALPGLRLVAPIFEREVEVNLATPAMSSPTAVSVLPRADEGISEAAPVVSSAMSMPPVPETVAVYATMPQAETAAVSAPSSQGLLAHLPLISAEMIAGFVLVLWMTGVVTALILCAMRSRRWRETLLAEAQPVPTELSHMAERMAARVGTERSFQLIMTGAANTPQIMGLRRPLLALPTTFTERYDRAEQEMALMHELTHLKRGDLLTLIVSEIGFSLQWFNPLIKHTRAALRADQEAACDEAVRALGVNTKSYAALLLKAATAGRPVPALTLDNNLKERITRMQNPLEAPLKRYGFALLAGVSALAVAGFTATRADVMVVSEHPEEKSEAEEDDLLDGLSDELKAAIKAERAEAAKRQAEMRAARAQMREEMEEKKERQRQIRIKMREKRAEEMAERRAQVEDARLQAAIDALLANQDNLDEKVAELRAAAEAANAKGNKEVTVYEFDSADPSSEEKIKKLLKGLGKDVDGKTTGLRTSRTIFFSDDDSKLKSLKSDDGKAIVLKPGTHREKSIFRLKTDKKGDAEFSEGLEFDGQFKFEFDGDDEETTITIFGPEGELEERVIGNRLAFLGHRGDARADAPSAIEKVISRVASVDFAEIRGPKVIVRTDEHEMHSGMVLLNDPFEGLVAPDLEPPMPPHVEIEAPKVTKKTTEEGTWILIPDEPDMSAFEAQMEEFEERMEEFGERMEEWGEKMGEAGEAIGDLAERCEEHRDESDEPIILREKISATGGKVKAVCATGGRKRMKSEEMAKFLERKGLSDDEMATFKEGLNDR